MPNMLLYILVAAGVTYAVRVLPLTLLRRPITSPFLQSFLYYVPYVTLSVMTFPAMVDATQSPIAGVAALAMGVFFAYRGASLPKVAALCCGTVLLLDSLPGDNGVRERMEAAKALLEEKGRQVRIYRWTSDSTAFANILRIERPKAVIAFEAAALTEMAELSRGEEAFPLLYGCGSTAGIAAALEKGRVTAIAAVNVFSAGYLAVEAAAKLARHESWRGAASVGFSVVRQETMYSSDNQKLLFPVT